MARKKSSDGDLGNNAYSKRGHELLRQAESADFKDRIQLTRTGMAYFHRGAMTDEELNRFIQLFAADQIRGYALIAAQKIGMPRGMKQSLDDSILWAIQNYSAEDAQKITQTRESANDGR